MSKGGLGEQGWAVAELQGLYGAFTFSELLLQRLWARRDFAEERAETVDGRRFILRRPGRWNRLGGPDFAEAAWSLGGEEMTGDVELHLDARDWLAHGHAGDLRYARVRLHVVLFPPATPWTAGADGKRIPVLVLLPLLRQSLEELVAEAATENLAQRPLDEARDWWGALEPGQQEALLVQAAGKRWAQKVHYARLRLERLGWVEACHHAALEVLGYRFNRAPLLGVAAEYQLAAWVDGGLPVAEIYEAYARAGRWTVQGVRPANHPLLRLQQYAAWAQARPRWVERLRDLGAQLPALGELGLANGPVRREFGLARLRSAWLEELTGGAVGGTRFDNLVCDGFLPLLAAHAPALADEMQGWWWAWSPGDLPPSAVRVLRDLGLFAPPLRPQAHGPWQGLLGWQLERERELNLKNVAPRDG